MRDRTPSFTFTLRYSEILLSQRRVQVTWAGERGVQVESSFLEALNVLLFCVRIPEKNLTCARTTCFVNSMVSAPEPVREGAAVIEVSAAQVKGHSAAAAAEGSTPEVASAAAPPECCLTEMCLKDGRVTAGPVHFETLPRPRLWSGQWTAVPLCSKPHSSDIVRAE